MLELLRVRAFAIIDELAVHFSPGFNVLTGATGAGTSLLADVLHPVLGGRAPAAARHRFPLVRPLRRFSGRIAHASVLGGEADRGAVGGPASGAAQPASDF